MEQAQMQPEAWLELTTGDLEAAEPAVPVRNDMPWQVVWQRWEQRLLWQVAVSVGLVALLLLAQRLPVGPLADVAALTTWALNTEETPVLPWTRVAARVEQLVRAYPWDLAQGLDSGGLDTGNMRTDGGARPAASGAAAWAAPVPGPFLAHGAAGAEFTAAAGTPVRAVADGVVRRVLPDAVAGSGVEVQIGGGLLVLYRPLGGVLPAPGTVVRRGAVLGRLSPPAGTAPRLHLELHRQGRAVDPAPFLAPGA